MWTNYFLLNTAAGRMVSLGGASFSRRRRGEVIALYRGMVYVETFYGVMVLLLGGMASPCHPTSPSTLNTAYTYYIFVTWTRPSINNIRPSSSIISL